MMNRNHQFQGLEKANALSRAGKHQAAESHYRTLLVRHPDHPAILMNKAIGQLNGGDGEGGVATLQQAMKACNHYHPVLRMVNRIASS